MPSPREKRRVKELHLHLGPEGAPWGQPSEMRALWTVLKYKYAVLHNLGPLLRVLH